MKVLLLPEAETDLLDGIGWFEQVSLHLGDQFEAEFYAVVDRIAGNPKQFSENKLGFRACRLKRFTAVMHFRIDGDFVVVARLLVNGREDKSVQGG